MPWVVLVILGGTPKTGHVVHGLLCRVTGALNLYMVTLEVRTHRPTGVNSGLKPKVALLAVPGPGFRKRSYNFLRNNKLLPISTVT